MLVGNVRVKKYLDEIVKEGSEAHAYLFFGPEMVGKTTFALQFARTLLCLGEVRPCEECTDCKLSSSLSHPDLYVMDSKEAIGVDEMRVLTKFLDLKPYQASRKIAIIAGIERMSISAANSFLKTLEEPTANTIIILTAVNPKNVLPTIVSRAQAVRFSACSDRELSEISFENSLTDMEMNQLFTLSQGSPGLFFRLANDKERTDKLIEDLKTFNQVQTTESYAAKINLAEKLSKDKENLGDFLYFLENYYHQKIKGGDNGVRLRTVYFLDKLSEVRDLLSKNVNSQLCLESLLFGGKEC